MSSSVARLAAKSYTVIDLVCFRTGLGGSSGATAAAADLERSSRAGVVVGSRDPTAAAVASDTAPFGTSAALPSPPLLLSPGSSIASTATTARACSSAADVGAAACAEVAPSADGIDAAASVVPFGADSVRKIPLA